MPEIKLSSVIFRTACWGLLVIFGASVAWATNVQLRVDTNGSRITTLEAKIDHLIKSTDEIAEDVKYLIRTPSHP